MHKVTYWAVFKPDKGGYSVYFPDLPGCIGFGSDLETAQGEAADALGLHLYEMGKNGEALSKSSEIPKIDPETAPGSFVSPVTVFPDLLKNELDNRRVKTNITLPVWLKEAAEQKGVNYSRLLETALLEYLGIRNHSAEGK